jgi:hypothetical protein
MFSLSPVLTWIAFGGVLMAASMFGERVVYQELIVRVKPNRALEPTRPSLRRRLIAKAFDGRDERA